MRHLLLLFSFSWLIISCTSSFLPIRSSGTKKIRSNTQYSSHQPKSASFLDSFFQDVQLQLNQRVAADPQFVTKSITEILLAAGTQLTAEVSRRGVERIVPECDFVFAGILTAIVGKYYSMWRVAPTVNAVLKFNTTATTTVAAVEVSDAQKYFWTHQVPTNALQPFLLDGVTRPSIMQRLAAIISPMPSLFQAGFLASLIGYGFTGILIQLRSWVRPSYIAATIPMNIFHACLYTGVFLATVSNIRYQILQGLIEPRIIDKIFKPYPMVRAFIIFWVRLANGLLGATLAIMGMKALNLQRLK